MKNKKIKVLLLAIVLCISCFLTCFTSIATNVFAYTIDVLGSYTTPLEDLQKDKTFDIEDYHAIKDDYSLQVISVAESCENELFVYVYQPNENYGKYVASSINISRTIGEDLNYKNYKLELINYDGVLQKYRVSKLVVSTEKNRYYDISSIYRKFDETIDPGLDEDNENIINEVVYKVAKRFYASTTSSGVNYSTKDIDVVTVTDKYVGFIRYENGNGEFAYLKEKCDSHFIAFSTNRRIDTLLEADVYYLKVFNQTVISGSVVETSDPPTEEYAYLDYTQVGSWTQDGLFGLTYEWDRIQSVKDFVTDPDLVLTDEGRADVLGKQWVLRFVETPFNYTMDTYNGIYVESNYSIEEVTILRLKFETAGVTYNLGVVDNKQTGDGIPDGRGVTFWEKLWRQLRIFLAILFLILLVVVLAPILPTLFNMAWTIFKIIFKIVLWVVTAPFKLIGRLFRKKRE